jgi:hypothetical protein
VLTQYLTRTGQLLQNPGAPVSLYSATDLTGYINEARGQVAAQGECIRSPGTLTLTQGATAYRFQDIAVTAGEGLMSPIHVRNLWQEIGSGGYHFISPRSFPWFAVYNLNNPVIQSQQGPPDEWTQQGQGVNGVIYFSPAPDTTYTVQSDSVWLPIPLVDDSTVDAIPALWSDAVPFLAAWFALLASQTGARQGDADRMMERYEQFMARARRGATPDILPDIWDQTPSPVRQNQLGLAPPHPRGGQQAPPQ